MEKVIQLCRQAPRGIVLSVECGTIDQAERSIKHLKSLLWPVNKGWPCNFCCLPERLSPESEARWRAQIILQSVKSPRAAGCFVERAGIDAGWCHARRETVCKNDRDSQTRSPGRFR